MELVESTLGRIVFARLSEDEDLLETITQVAQKTNVSAGFFLLIGTLKKAKLGFFRGGKYEAIEMNQPFEIVSCVGNVSVKDGKSFAHAHIAVSDEEGRVFGGHVMQGCIIGATGELVLVTASDVRLLRTLDEKTRLYLWSLNKSSSEGASEKSPAV